jgi:hypothetical protein
MSQGKTKNQNVLGKDSFKASNPRSPGHLNGHQLVACSATYYPEGILKAIAFMPIDIDFQFVDGLPPLLIEVQSRKVSLDSGVSPDAVPDIISEWHSGMNLPYGKKVVPVAWDAHSCQTELRKLIDEDMEDTFHTWKCLRQMCHFMNDVAINRGERAPFPKDNLGSCASRVLGDDFLAEAKRDVGYLCLVTINVYKHLLYNGYKL